MNKIMILIGSIYLFGIHSMASSQLADTACPKFQYDINNTGRSSFKGIDYPVFKWKYPASITITSSAVINPDGLICITSHDGTLYTLTPDGECKWKFYDGFGSLGSSTPAIRHDGTIFVGSYENMYALKPDGGLEWKFRSVDHGVFGTPTISNDELIYICCTGGERDFLHSIKPDGEEYCNFDISETNSCPMIDSDKTIYAGSSDWITGGYFDSLFAVNPRCSQKWKIDLINGVTTSYSMDDEGVIYFGSGNYLHAIYSDGHDKWSFPVTLAVNVAPAIGHDGTVYVGSVTDNNLYALMPDGSLKWKFETKESIWSSPVIDPNETIYFGSDDNNLYALKADGYLKWSFSTEGKVRSSPTIDKDGNIYFGSMDYNFYALGDPPNPTPTLTRTPTLTLTKTPTRTLTITSSTTISATKTPTLTYTSTKTPTQTPTLTPTSTMTITETPTQTPNTIRLESFFVKVIDKKVFIFWKTGSEIDTLGFYIVRIDNLNNEFMVLNKKIIPAQGNFYSGNNYTYEDNNIAWGRIYYYWLIEVDIYARFSIHGPIMNIMNLIPFYN
jgi:outer membrane protein assembly factor BamB